MNEEDIRKYRPYPDLMTIDKGLFHTYTYEIARDILMNHYRYRTTEDNNDFVNVAPQIFDIAESFVHEAQERGHLKVATDAGNQCNTLHVARKVVNDYRSTEKKKILEDRIEALNKQLIIFNDKEEG